MPHRKTANPRAWAAARTLAENAIFHNLERNEQWSNGAKTRRTSTLSYDTA